MLSCDAEGVVRGGADANVQSLAQEFWALLNTGSNIEASEIARRLAPPHRLCLDGFRGRLAQPGLVYY